jgi:hypothetical protein
MIQPDLGVLSSRERPWFAARHAGGKTIGEGTANCLLGHRLAPGRDGIPDGIFASWDWDGELLTVRNDRYGIYPLFYACHGGEIRLSPSMQHVLDGRFPKTLDHAALAVFFRLGFFLGEDTPFEHVRALPPGCTLEWRAGKLTIGGGSLDTSPTAPVAATFDEAVEQYAHLFRQAIARRRPADDAFTVPISGGRDSRHILFELLAQGHKPDLTLTVRARPPSSNEDIRIARLLKQELQLNHVEIDMPLSYFRANLKDIEITEYCGSGHIWLLPVSAWLKGRTHTLYDGLAGSVLSGGFQLNEEKMALFRDGRLQALATQLLREARGMDHFLQTALRPELSRRMTEAVAVERMAAELERHRGARNPLISYIFWNRTRRGVGLIPYSILSHIDRVYTPYLDHDVFDFLINLDVSFSLGNALHDETIRRSYPQYAHLPYEEKETRGQKGHDHSSYYRRSVRELLAHCARHPGMLGSKLLKSERILAMTARDLVRRRCDAPWYLRPALYLLELEKLQRKGAP